MPRRFESDSDLDRELELEFADEEVETDGNEETEFEVLDEPEREGSAGDFAERLYELSLRELESETAMDEVLNPILNEMEREYFFKGLTRRLKSAGKRLLKRGISSLSKYVKGKLPAVAAITQLARGNLKGVLGSLAKAALRAGLSAVPGGAIAAPALQALGFEAGGSEDQRVFWNNYVSLAREAYDTLAANLNEQAEDHEEAQRLASASYRSAFQRVARGSPSSGGVRRIQVRRGEKILIEVV